MSRRLLASASISILIGCSAPREPEAAPPASATVTPLASSPHDPEPGAAPAGPRATSVASAAPSAPSVLDIAVPGFEPALVVTPASEGPAPVVVVTHGAGGSAEPHCQRYAELTRGLGFVLCTRGRPMDRQLPPEQRGYFYDGHHELGREVVAALGALVEKFGARVDREGITYAGYSQGAAMGILYLQQGGAAANRVRSILLVEGGAGDWSIGLSAKLLKEGVARVAIVCGQPRCHASARQSLLWMRKGGLDARVAHAAGAGHTYGGAVAPLVDEAWAWLSEGDPRWRPAP